MKCKFNDYFYSIISFVEFDNVNIHLIFQQKKEKRMNKEKLQSLVEKNLGISRRKKKVLAPGEMEQVVLKKSSFADYPEISKITICTEVE